MTAHLVFTGSLNRDGSGVGLAVYSFDDRTLKTKKLAEARDIDNPSFLSVTSDGARIYANSEVESWRESTVSAYSFDRSTNALAYINKQPTLGSVAAHNMITRDGSKLLVSNYGTGEGGPDQAVAVFGIRADGGLTPATGSAAQTGSGPDTRRQERSHPHSATETIAGGVAIVANLGTDRLVSYRIAGDGQLTLLSEFALAPGAGPRHLALHPSGRFVFATNELDSTVVSLSLDNSIGRLAVIDTKPAAPASTPRRNFPADIHVSPDGRFLYASNRGHNSVAVFAVDQDDGSLALVDRTPCGGNWPRNLALTPSGGHLFSANQKADRISIFSRDAVSGRLTDTGKAIEIGTPMCVKIVV